MERISKVLTKVWTFVGNSLRYIDGIVSNCLLRAVAVSLGYLLDQVQVTSIGFTSLFSSDRRKEVSRASFLGGDGVAGAGHNLPSKSEQGNLQQLLHHLHRPGRRHLPDG